MRLIFSILLTCITYFLNAQGKQMTIEDEYIEEIEKNNSLLVIDCSPGSQAKSDNTAKQKRLLNHFEQLMYFYKTT